MTFQQGATFGSRPKFSSWSLDIGRNDPVEEVSPSPHLSCGTYFLPTSDFSTTSINFSGRDSKLIIYATVCFTPQRIDVNSVISNYYYYYYYYYIVITLLLKLIITIIIVGKFRTIMTT